jgi:hypothetical protein
MVLRPGYSGWIIDPATGKTVSGYATEDVILGCLVGAVYLIAFAAVVHLRRTRGAHIRWVSYLIGLIAPLAIAAVVNGNVAHMARF